MADRTIHYSPRFRTSNPATGKIPSSPCATPPSDITSSETKQSSWRKSENRCSYLHFGIGRRFIWNAWGGACPERRETVTSRLYVLQWLWYSRFRQHSLNLWRQSYYFSDPLWKYFSLLSRRPRFHFPLPHFHVNYSLTLPEIVFSFLYPLLTSIFLPADIFNAIAWLDFPATNSGGRGCFCIYSKVPILPITGVLNSSEKQIPFLCASFQVYCYFKFSSFNSNPGLFLQSADFNLIVAPNVSGLNTKNLFNIRATELISLTDRDV